VLPELWEYVPLSSRMSRGRSLGGYARDLVAPTTYLEDVNGGPLGGNAEDPRVPTTYLEDIGGGPPCPPGGSSFYE
jgi:hypothetical protein